MDCPGLDDDVDDKPVLHKHNGRAARIYKDLFSVDLFRENSERVSRLKEVKVAILDSGVDELHTELKDSLKEYRNFTDPFEDSRDYIGHGTHVAGLLAGKNVGVAHGVGLYVAKICLKDGRIDSRWVTQALRWAVEEKVHIISMSLGGSYSDDVWKSVQVALLRGQIVVCAAGNADTRFDSNVQFPASIGGVVRVGSTTHYGGPAPHSSVGGPWITVAAPGEALISAWPGIWVKACFRECTVSYSPYAAQSGTSFATPLIAGLCAWLLAFDRATNIDPSENVDDTNVNSGLIRNAHCMESLLRRLCSNASGERAKGNGIPSPKLILKSADLLRVLLADIN
jgi:subtilisin family serine protease